MFEVGRPLGPLAQPVLYPHHLWPGASPKAISGRTSYLQVRLVFRRYPQLIQRFFKTDWCGLPPRVNGVSPWPWVGHLVSGVRDATGAPC